MSPDSVKPHATSGVYALPFDLTWSEISVNRLHHGHPHIVLNNAFQQGMYLKMIHIWNNPSVQLFSFPLLLIAVLWHAVLEQINQCQLALLALSLALFYVFSISLLFSPFHSHISAFDFLWLCSFVSFMWTQCLF